MNMGLLAGIVRRDGNLGLLLQSPGILPRMAHGKWIMGLGEFI